MERDQEEGRGRSPRRGAVVDIGRRGEGGRSVPLAASDPELEAQVVGAILSDNLLLRRIPFLTPDHFSDEINAKLWRIACEMINSGRRAVPVTVSAALGGTAGEAGAVSFLSSLAELGRLIGPAIPDAAERLRSLSQTRILADIRDEIGRSIASGSVHPDEALSAVLRRARAAIESGRDTSRGKREVAAAAIGEALIPRDPVTTGIQGLDFLMHGGLIRRRLYGIGGLTGRGKTILLGTVSDNLNARDDKHLVISLETPPEDFELRSCAKHLRINASAILDPDSPRHDAFARNAERYVEAIPDNTRYEYLPGGTMDQIHRCILRAFTRTGFRASSSITGSSSEARKRACRGRRTSTTAPIASPPSAAPKTSGAS
jgi:replicative DNA helicase